MTMSKSRSTLRNPPLRTSGSTTRSFHFEQIFIESTSMKQWVELRKLSELGGDGKSYRIPGVFGKSSKLGKYSMTSLAITLYMDSFIEKCSPYNGQII